MAFDYENTFKRIIAKTEIIEQRYLKILETLDAANARIEELERLNAAKDRELEQLKVKNEYLRMATTIAPTRDQMEGARAMISGLIRDIDRCITDLSD
ncbi:MAG: hypothetical protein K2K05_00980 [Muribaculaceae bacterium]|nr:hypothetical protein [Muribaculaceae bacterium]MDE6691937.1 hypothetical protein [Muribaculaceae bacterium]